MHMQTESAFHLSKITEANVITSKIPHNSTIIGIKHAHLLG